MKATTVFAGTLVLAASANAGYTGLYVENFVGEGWADHGYVGLTTYRLYATFDSEDDVLLAVNGSSVSAMEWVSEDGSFWNSPQYDSLTAPVMGFPTYVGVWINQWDTYVTIDDASYFGDATALSPGFAAQVGDLTGDFSTENAAYYVTPADYPQGLSDGYRVMIAQVTVAEGVSIGGKLNLLLDDGSEFFGQSWFIPAPGALALLGLARLTRRRRRR